jgi:hypothetical protein
MPSRNDLILELNQETTMAQSRSRRGPILLCSAFGGAGPAAAIATIGGVISLGGVRAQLQRFGNPPARWRSRRVK